MTHATLSFALWLESRDWRYDSKGDTAQVLTKLHATVQRAERPVSRFLERIGRLPRVDAKTHAKRDEDGEDVGDGLTKQPREQRDVHGGERPRAVVGARGNQRISPCIERTDFTFYRIITYIDLIL